MSPYTVFLSKLLGLLTMLVSLSVFTHRKSSLETVSLLVHDRPLVLIIGLIALISGLAMVLSHNIWSGGILPVVITLVGWSLAIRGTLLLFLSPEALLDLVEVARLETLFLVYMTIIFVFGLYLTYAGFKASR
jgi:vacuolar-type H+-ATPase subunit I/STV1